MCRSRVLWSFQWKNIGHWSHLRGGGRYTGAVFFDVDLLSSLHRWVGDISLSQLWQASTLPCLMRDTTREGWGQGKEWPLSSLSAPSGSPSPSSAVATLIFEKLFQAENLLFICALFLTIDLHAISITIIFCNNAYHLNWNHLFSIVAMWLPSQIEIEYQVY